MPTHTSCNLGCKFCHLTPLKNPAKNLSHQEISEGIDYIIKDLKLRGCTVLLISYMGSGDPLMNVEGVIESAKTTIIEHSSRFCGVRFAISTMMPYIEILENSGYSMIGFTEAVKTNDLPFKVHFSLHSPFDDERKKLMPCASSIQECIRQLRWYKYLTGNQTEIHYSLMARVNDRDKDLSALVELLKGTGIPVKFLSFNPRKGYSLEGSPKDRVGEFMSTLSFEGIKTEFYMPPGADVGASCGQFLESSVDYDIEISNLRK